MIIISDIMSTKCYHRRRTIDLLRTKESHHEDNNDIF
jgi:hypothetical protein